MTVAARIAEAVARGASRRSSVTAAATVAFAGFAGFAAHGRGEAAERCAVRLVEDTSCNPPWGRYCDGQYGDESPVGGSCDGSTCGSGCTFDDAYYPQAVQAACWCTALEREGRNRYAYWKCCDCQCPSIAPACEVYPASSSCRDPVESQQYDCGCRERINVTFEPVSRRRQGR